MIPKKIHYCWFGPKPLPQIVLKCMNSWNDHLRDYEFHLWNEDNFPMNFSFVKEAYSAKKYAFVSDYVRFWALYEHGGIYLDTDMYLIRSLNSLLDNQSFYGWETKSNQSISCGVIGARRQDSFIKEILVYYESISYQKNNISQMVVPRIITNCFQGFKDKEQITIYPYDYFYPFPYEEKDNSKNFLRFKTQNTYAIHLWNISWGTRQDKMRDKLIYWLKRIIHFFFNN